MNEIEPKQPDELKPHERWLRDEQRAAQLTNKAKLCRGCRDSFYNRGCEFCWSLESARLVHRWRTNLWTPMDSRKNFTKVRVYDCYHGEGNQRDIFMKRLPEHLGGEYADSEEENQNEHV